MTKRNWPKKWITLGLPTDTQGWVYESHFKVPFKAPQLEWIAKQYSNKCIWLSACDRFSIHVTDQGKFYACRAGWEPHPAWNGDNEFDTFSEATAYCEKFLAQLNTQTVVTPDIPEHTSTTQETFGTNQPV